MRSLCYHGRVRDTLPRPKELRALSALVGLSCLALACGEPSSPGAPPPRETSEQGDRRAAVSDTEALVEGDVVVDATLNQERGEGTPGPGDVDEVAGDAAEAEAEVVTDAAPGPDSVPGVVPDTSGEGDTGAQGDALPSDADAAPGPGEGDVSETLPPDSGLEPVEDGGVTYPKDDLLRLNHIQVKGTHNSYHQAPFFVLHPSHNYTHPPLDVQLEDYGVRAFELDLHLEGDVIEVYHIVWVDEESSCGTFAECLQVMKGWSDLNPGHLPIMVWLEAKETTGGGPFTDLGVVDAAILEVFPEERLITPDDVRGEYATLREAIEAEGWPTLGEVRDKAMFMVLNGGSGTDAYTYGGQHLEGRVMFMGASPDAFSEPWAAVAKINDPGSSHVPEAHAANILVASNGCAADSEAEACYARLQTAFESGVQMYKDDFLTPSLTMDYWLDFPDGNPARCNQVSAPPECTPEALESLEAP